MFLEIVTKQRETKPTVIFTWDYLGPVYTYSDILENGLFSSVFQKNTCLTDRQRIGIVFACLFEIVNQWKYDGIPYGACVVLVVNDAWHHCIRKHPLLSLTARKRRSQRFLKISLWRAFQKRCVFCDRFGGIRVDGRPNRREKSPFQTKTDTCGRGYGEFHKEGYA